MSEEKKTSKLAFLDNHKFFKKIKQFKHIGILVVVIFVLILLLIMFGDLNFFNFNQTTETIQASTYTAYYQYAEKLENKLKNVLCKIKGAGNVEVMITLDSTVTVQNSEKTTYNYGQKSTKNSDLVLAEEDNQELQKPTDILPKITGVVIVSSGAVDTSVRLNLLTATQTLLDLSQNKIQIFVGN